MVCVAFFAVTGLITLPQGVQAANESRFSGTATFTTEYIWHGYSKSDGNAVFQANLDYHHSSGLFGGLWFSQVDFGDDRIPGFKHISELEFIPYVGYSFRISDDWQGDVQVNRYIYNSDFFVSPRNNNKRASGDYSEFSTNVSFRDLLSAHIGITDDGYGRGGVYADYELTARYPITDLFEFSTKVGYVQSRRALNFNYLYWDAGVGFYYRILALDFRYTQSKRSNRMNQRRGGFDAIEPTFVFTVSLGF
jgi:uncharacterized protein (TIGR02001 family)